MRGALASSKLGGRRKKNLEGIVCFCCFFKHIFTKEFQQNNIGGKKRCSPSGSDHVFFRFYVFHTAF